MKLSLVAGILAIIAGASIITAVVFVNLASPADPAFLDRIELPMDIKVEDHFAFNTDVDAIHFGKVPPGNEGLRGFFVNNTYPFQVVANLEISGDITSWVSASENVIVLEPNSHHKINLTASVPLGTAYGLYEGTLAVTFRRN